MTVRPVTPCEAGTWIELRTALWPDSRQDHLEEVAAYFEHPSASATCLVAEGADGALLGFAEVGQRGYAEGCRTSPVGYLEGIFVVPVHRGRGVGRALVRAAEMWARDRGCSEMASDRELTNESSGAFHVALGYEEVQRIVCFRRPLSSAWEAA